MDFDLKKLSALCNAIEQMSATAEDNGEEDFGIRLNLDDAKMLVRALLLLEQEIKDCEDELSRLRNHAMLWDVISSVPKIKL